MSNIINIIGATEIADRIKKLGKQAKSVQEEIHTLAVSCLAHVRDHGNTTLILNLINALPKGVRREGLAVWIGRFSNSKLSVRLSGDAYTAKLDKKREATDFDIDGAWTTPFYELTKEKRPGESLTVEKLVAWLKKKANEDGTFDDGTPKVSVEAQDLAAALVAYADEMATPKLQVAA